MKTLRMLMRYKAWADRLLFQSLARVPAEALAKPQPIVFGSLLRTLNHVHAMDEVWRAHLTSGTTSCCTWCFTAPPRPCRRHDVLAARAAADHGFAGISAQCRRH